MDYDVHGLWFGAQVVPYDDEVRPALAAVCGEERYAVHFQMSAFPGALTGGLAGGVLRDFALRIGGGGVGGLGSARARRPVHQRVRRSIGCSVRRRGFWRRGDRKGRRRQRVLLAGRAGRRRRHGREVPERFDDRGCHSRADRRTLKETNRTASGRPEYTGHRDAETKRGQLRLNHADHVRTGSTATADDIIVVCMKGRRRGQVREREGCREDVPWRGD